MAEIELYKFIDALDISSGWKKTFKLIHLVYHRNYYDGNFKNTLSWTSLPEISTLDMKDKLKFFCTFNFFALIFGPLYYIAKGMYPKGIVLLIACWFLYAFNNITACFIPVILIHCAIFANADYFVYKILGNPKIQSEPTLLEDSFDPDHFNEIAEGKNPTPMLAPAVILICALILVNMGFSAYNAYVNTMAAVQIPVLCTTKENCKEPLAENMANLKTGKEKKYIVEYKIACIYTIIKNKPQAIKYLDDSIRHNPKYVPSYFLRASLFMDVENYLAAIDNYKLAMRVDKKLVGANYNIGRCYYKLKDYQRALKFFQIATKRYPFNASYFEMQGYTKVYLKNITGAKKDLKHAAALYSINIFTPDKNRADTVKRYVEML